MLFIYVQSDQSLASRVRAQSTLPHSTLGAGPNQLHVATYKVPRPYNNTDSLQHIRSIVEIQSTNKMLI